MRDNRIIIRQKLDETDKYRVIIRSNRRQKIYILSEESVDELYDRWRNGLRFKGYDWDRW